MVAVRGWCGLPWKYARVAQRWAVVHIAVQGARDDCWEGGGGRPAHGGWPRGAGEIFSDRALGRRGGAGVVWPTMGII